MKTPILFLSLAAAFFACSGVPEPKGPKSPETSNELTQQNEEKMNEPVKEDIYVVMTTSLGEVTIALDAQNAPVTVENFLSYVDDGYYSGTIFHRVIPNFMIQGGGFTPDGAQKQTKDPIVLESRNGLKNLTGTIAMARTNDPNSATSQFFINVIDNSFLDYNSGNPGYAVFGKVTAGMDVVNQIRQVPTGKFNGMGDWPTEVVSIKSIARL
jgi:cyclophilin family peptidyl-prolyl cis-trans isomerase